MAPLTALDGVSKPGKMCEANSIEEADLATLYEKYTAVLPPGPGVCINDIGTDQVPETVVCRYFGQKSSKSGWKYNGRQTDEEAASIYNLWQRVYDERLMPNKEISLQFARGLILQSQGTPVDWVEFAVARERYRRGVRFAKGKPINKFSENEERLGAKVSILGKKRCFLGTPPPVVILTEKSDVPGEEDMGKKVNSGFKGKGLGKCVVGVPSWSSSEVLDMEVGIAGCKTLTDQLRDELSDGSRKKESLEAEVRRAEMNLSDRRVLFVESESALRKLREEEAVIKARISETCLSLASSAPCPVLQETLRVDEGRVEQIAMDKRIEDRTMTRSDEVIRGCEETIKRVGGQLQKSTSRVSEVFAKVRALEAVLVSMGQQMGRMQQGGGNQFYPRPIFSNPVMPLSTVHVLNACPLCGLWYSCFNFVSLGCGHTYHHWCLSEHVLKSRTCLVESCEEKIGSESEASIGIRPVGSVGSNDNISGKDKGACTKNAATTKPTQSVSDGKFPAAKSLDAPESTRDESPEPGWESDQLRVGGNLLSQCSETAIQADYSEENKCCMLCNTQPAVVLLKDCGHDRFCFPCTVGLRACPICKLHISGWERIEPESTVSPLLLSLGNASDVARDSLLASKSTTRKRREPPIIAEQREKFAANDEDLSTDDDNSPTGRKCWTWCTDDVFEKGGARSIPIVMEGEINDEGTEAEINGGGTHGIEKKTDLQESDEADELTAKAPQAKRVKPLRALGDLLATPLAPGEQNTVARVQSQSSTLYKTKKKTGRLQAISKAPEISTRVHSSITRASASTCVQPPRSTPRARVKAPARFHDLP